ncbi:glutathione S-transferase omega-1-like [Lytechinus variegatus]|uniref:glutathione S-transferase omega-1-like n=1 Tax=Lytechinus variegatus TaxID=7654 RepID=UPI001BB222F8|nr:glutathione S-transferase omega-1-like [Lytechinus variegatus]
MTPSPKPNPKHIVQGEPLPPLKKGVPRLYSFRFCPFAHRARLVLAAKNVDYELVNISLSKKPEWYFSKNPFGTTPCFEHDEKIVRDSTLVCEYVNDAYPDHGNLWPSDPYRKAQDKMLLDYFGSKISPPFFKATYHPPESPTEDYLAIYQKELYVLEDELKKRGTAFFFGNRPGLVDYIMWPWFERWTVFGEEFKRDNYPTLMGYCARMKEDPAVIEASTPDEIYQDQFKRLLEKNPQDDY